MSKNKIYIVTMYRWGDRENHSYVHGVYNKKQKAIDKALEEQICRGGKYHPEVLEADINTTDCENFKVVLELEHNRWFDTKFNGAGS